MSIGNRIYAELQGDRAVWMIVAMLSIFSILAVYSATGHIAFKYRAGATESYLIKHLFLIFGGLVITYLCYLMHYTQYSKIAPLLLVISIPLLIYTIAFGVEVNEARRWLEIPFVGITFQTSDFAKLALIIYVARAISAKQDYIKDFNSAFLPIVVPILIICGLIAPSDLSTALLLFFTCIVMMFLGRVSFKYIILLLFLGVVVFAFLIVIGEFFPGIVRTDTWVERMTDFVENTEGAYQVKHSKIAIANGGYFGEGPGNSSMRNYLPAPYSDFIYAIICEEYGLVGGFTIIGLYVMLFFRSVSIVTKSPKAFGAMLVLGLGLIVSAQAMANIAVSVHLVPVTGLNLPLISKGGTSIIFSSIAFGMILSVSRYIEKTE
ncbi:MAG: cell division protein FtsW [Saprospiraceae bacterium]|jgi:cell division protein FtsW